MGHTTFLGLVLVWAGPIIIVEWLLGLDLIIRRWKVWLPAILIPTVYLTIADSFRQSTHLWTVNTALSLRIQLPFGVPFEAFLFFLLMNTLLVQGLLLVSSPRLRHRIERAWRIIRRGREALVVQNKVKNRAKRANTAQ
jgi:lycopene cyclase domain-containing protein